VVVCQCVTSWPASNAGSVSCVEVGQASECALGCIAFAFTLRHSDQIKHSLAARPVDQTIETLPAYVSGMIKLVRAPHKPYAC
jgi:hypothetical protein